MPPWNVVKESNCCGYAASCSWKLLTMLGVERNLITYKTAHKYPNSSEPQLFFQVLFYRRYINRQLCMFSCRIIPAFHLDTNSAFLCI